MPHATRFCGIAPRLLVALLLAAGLGCASSAHAAPPAGDTRAATAPQAPLRVMSFNLRRPVFFDFSNAWDERKALLVKTVKRFDPDVLGTQECVSEQADYIKDHLDNYGFVGYGRDDGQRGGEMCGIFFRKSRLTKLDQGNFWLSETPSQAGSVGWDAAYPRVCTWVKFQALDSGRAFFVFNTHLDNAGETARQEGAKLIRARIASLAGDTPVLLTGDFNADAGSKPYRVLVRDADGLKLVDTYREENSESSTDGTYHGFTGLTRGPRIDWVLRSRGLDARTSGINHYHEESRYPSDHFPVQAVLRFKAAAPAGRSE